MFKDKESDQGLLFYTIEQYQHGTMSSYWAGVATATVGCVLIFFVSLWVLGAFLL